MYNWYIGYRNLPSEKGFVKHSFLWGYKKKLSAYSNCTTVETEGTYKILVKMSKTDIK